MQSSIFQFDDLQEFLKEVGPAKFGGNHKAFSLKAWSLRLGYSSHRTMAMVVNGSRLPSIDMIDRLSTYFEFTQNERRYFELLVLKKRHQANAERRQQIEILLQGAKPKLADDTNLISEHTWDLIYAWYYMVIKQLVGVKGFVAKPGWISRRLRNKVCHADIRKTLQVMKHLKMIVEDQSTGDWRELKSDIFTRGEVPSATRRMHHRQMMERALEALEEQEMEQRDFRGLTLRFSKKNLTAAKKDIGDFIASFNQKYSAEECADSVYQLNTQLFEHTLELDS